MDDINEKNQEEDQEELSDKESEDPEVKEDKEPFEEEKIDSDEMEAEEDSTDEEAEELESEVEFRGFNPNEDKEESLVYDTPVRKKSGMKKFIIWLSILAVLALVVGWFITTNVFKGGGQVKVAQDTSPSPSATPTPTPASEQKLNRSEWSIEVLNGSGTSGLAKKIADQLKDLGYNVIKVGNADKQTYTESQILVKSDLKDKVDPVIADIKDVIKISSSAGEIKDSTASAQIIIGKEN